MRIHRNIDIYHTNLNMNVQILMPLLEKKKKAKKCEQIRVLSDQARFRYV